MPEDTIQITLHGDPRTGEVVLGFPDAGISVRMGVRGALDLSAMLVQISTRIKNRETAPMTIN